MAQSENAGLNPSESPGQLMGPCLCLREPRAGSYSITFQFALLALWGRSFAVCLHQPNACQEPGGPCEQSPAPGRLEPGL